MKLSIKSSEVITLPRSPTKAFNSLLERDAKHRRTRCLSSNPMSLSRGFYCLVLLAEVTTQRICCHICAKAEGENSSVGKVFQTPPQHLPCCKPERKIEKGKKNIWWAIKVRWCVNEMWIIANQLPGSETYIICVHLIFTCLCTFSTFTFFYFLAFLHIFLFIFITACLSLPCALVARVIAVIISAKVNQKVSFIAHKPYFNATCLFPPYQLCYTCSSV